MFLHLFHEREGKIQDQIQKEMNEEIKELVSCIYVPFIHICSFHTYMFLSYIYIPFIHICSVHTYMFLSYIHVLFIRTCSFHTYMFTCSFHIYICSFISQETCSFWSHFIHAQPIPPPLTISKSLSKARSSSSNISFHWNITETWTKRPRAFASRFESFWKYQSPWDRLYVM